MVPRQPALHRRGFTLVEAGLVVGVIGVLLAILLPAIGYALARAQSFRCQSSLRSVAFDFQVFASDELHGDRGTDSQEFGRNVFSIVTFMESQYGVDEFWEFGDADMATRPDPSGADPMRCSRVRGEITLRRGVPCTNGAVGPSENVSYAFNMRLHRVEYIASNGQPRNAETRLRSTVLDQGRVPLVMDVDGAAAADAGQSALLTAPSLDSQGLYANDALWFPGRRHLGAMNVAFIDGSVASSDEPLAEADWDWAWQPKRR